MGRGGVLPERGERLSCSRTGNLIMILTRKNLEALFNCNAPNARQIVTLGLRYPLRKGWMHQLIGQEISDALYAELMDCKGRRPRGISKKQWRKPCTPCE